jgi:uncharacterized cupredoxin-like copper-binding protein
MIRSPVWARTALVLLAAGAIAGCRSAEGGQSDAREIRIVMTDFKYEPDQITVKPGERVRFVLVNQGAVEHELVLGDQAKQEQHEAEMARGGHHMGNRPGEKSVAAGKTDRMEFTFPGQPGALIYGCHVPGHWTAGMKGTVTIQ